MKITHVKAMVAKVFTVGLLAGAVVMAAPSKAEAQFGVAVRVGPAVPYYGPRYRRPIVVEPAYGFRGPVFYGPRHEWERHDFDRRYDRRDFDRRYDRR